LNGYACFCRSNAFQPCFAARFHTYSCEDSMFKPYIVAALAALLSVGTVAAQTAASRPDPLDAGASVPVTTYKSSFGAYRAQSEPEVAPWRDSNDTAARIGGWRAYAREAQGAEAATPAPAVTPPASAVTPPAPAKPVPADTKKPMHDGHHMHGGGKHAH
jgi:hypothetical protein